MIVAPIHAIVTWIHIGPARCRDQGHHDERGQDHCHRAREVARLRVAVVGIETGIRLRRQVEEGGEGAPVTQAILAIVIVAAAGIKAEAEAETGTEDNCDTSLSKGHCS